MHSGRDSCVRLSMRIRRIWPEMIGSVGKMLTILLSHERSGSHFVGSFLASLPRIAMVDEVCNPHAMPPRSSELSFFRYKHERFVADDDLILNPNLAKHEQFIVGFFERLRNYAPKSHVVVDIKYGHVPLFEGVWWPILSRPYLFKFCESQGISIIHLHRGSVISAVISQMVSQQRRLWHSWQHDADKTRNQKHELNPARVVAEAKMLREQIDFVRNRWMGGVRHLDITYEDVNGTIGTFGDIDHKIASFLDRKPEKPFSSRYEKLISSPAAVVVNYSEVISACIEAGLEDPIIS